MTTDKVKLDYFERKLGEMQVQMRELVDLVMRSQAEHAQLQAWAMHLKPYREYGFPHRPTHSEDETD